ncbi:vWA domain-containing protein [Thermoflavimicrobium dichotomicum]|uniref:VWFA domain-containing protein n=1 Tax=Thermoflavimicrobium dichotomicum TaxID=46223 RepID=A0A1I3KGZ8_9BACL|nr:VWA domain-containing protein [Thermoflavimicrobium dichotomicum]SFI71610.1 hypothetical protein SAMN05421852_101452 [Thermoflavimicrobium dichotomicum]
MERIDLSGLTKMTATLIRQVQDFAPFLRKYGFRVGTPETLAALKCLEEADLSMPEQLFFALRSVYARSPVEWASFPHLFERHFLNRGTRLEEKKRVQLEDRSGHSRGPAVTQDHSSTVSFAMQPGSSPNQGERYALQADSNQLQAVLAVTKRALRQFDSPPGRRFRRGGRDRVNLRATMRESVRYAGEPLRLRWQQYRPDRPSVVLLIDISGSMKEYAPFMTALAWSFTRLRLRSEVFVFSTRLKRVTHLVARKAVKGITVSELTELKGGTRIGEALEELQHRYGGLLRRHTFVIIVSDGFDAGHPERLRSALQSLSERVRHMVWINPLLGDPGYEPISSGMTIARPYIHRLVDVHDLDSWREAVESQIFRPISDPVTPLPLILDSASPSGEGDTNPEV